MNKYYGYILIGAGLWGTIGWFVKHLYELGFTPMEVVTLRTVSAAVMLVLFLSFRQPAALKLKAARDIKYFIGTGIFSIVMFNYCMFTAIELTTIPIATALLYTGPAFVLLLSVILFKEVLTKRKLFALILTLTGVLFVVGVTPNSIASISNAGVLLGIGSGFGYALYSIFSKYALVKYSSLQVTTFTFAVAAISLLPFFPYKEKAGLLLEPAALLFAFGLGFAPTALAYIIYTYGLIQVEASKASILATVEPVVATLIGVFVFLEPFSISQFIGITCIIFAVILLQMQFRRKANIKLR